MPIGMFFGMPGAEETKAITKQFARIGQPTVEAAEGGVTFTKKGWKTEEQILRNYKIPSGMMPRHGPMFSHVPPPNRKQSGTIRNSQSPHSFYFPLGDTRHISASSKLST